jgi:hypothetical protein
MGVRDIQIQQIEWRRSKVIEMRARGLSQIDTRAAGIQAMH